MGIQNEETIQCLRPSHAPGATSMCASIDGGVVGRGSTDPAEMEAVIWQKALFKAHLEFMAEKLKTMGVSWNLW